MPKREDCSSANKTLLVLSACFLTDGLAGTRELLHSGNSSASAEQGVLSAPATLQPAASSPARLGPSRGGGLEQGNAANGTAPYLNGTGDNLPIAGTGSPHANDDGTEHVNAAPGPSPTSMTSSWMPVEQSPADLIASSNSAPSRGNPAAASNGTTNGQAAGSPGARSSVESVPIHDDDSDVESITECSLESGKGAEHSARRPTTFTASPKHLEGVLEDLQERLAKVNAKIKNPQADNGVAPLSENPSELESKIVNAGIKNPQADNGVARLSENPSELESKIAECKAQLVTALWDELKKNEKWVWDLMEELQQSRSQEEALRSELEELQSKLQSELEEAGTPEGIELRVARAAATEAETAKAGIAEELPAAEKKMIHAEPDAGKRLADADAVAQQRLRDTEAAGEAQDPLAAINATLYNPTSSPFGRVKSADAEGKPESADKEAVGESGSESLAETAADTIAKLEEIMESCRELREELQAPEAKARAEAETAQQQNSEYEELRNEVQKLPDTQPASEQQEDAIGPLMASTRTAWQGDPTALLARVNAALEAAQQRIREKAATKEEVAAEVNRARSGAHGNTGADRGTKTSTETGVQAGIETRDAETQTDRVTFAADERAECKREAEEVERKLLDVIGEEVGGLTREVTRLGSRPSSSTDPFVRTVPTPPKKPTADAASDAADATGPVVYGPPPVSEETVVIAESVHEDASHDLPDSGDDAAAPRASNAERFVEEVSAAFSVSNSQSEVVEGGGAGDGLAGSGVTWVASGVVDGVFSAERLDSLDGGVMGVEVSARDFQSSEGGEKVPGVWKDDYVETARSAEDDDGSGSGSANDPVVVPRVAGAGFAEAQVNEEVDFGSIATPFSQGDLGRSGGGGGSSSSGGDMLRSGHEGAADPARSDRTEGVSRASVSGSSVDSEDSRRQSDNERYKKDDSAFKKVPKGKTRVKMKRRRRDGGLGVVVAGIGITRITNTWVKRKMRLKMEWVRCKWCKIS